MPSRFRSTSAPFSSAFLFGTLRAALRGDLWNPSRTHAWRLGRGAQMYSGHATRGASRIDVDRFAMICPQVWTEGLYLHRRRAGHRIQYDSITACNEQPRKPSRPPIHSYFLFVLLQDPPTRWAPCGPQEAAATAGCAIRLLCLEIRLVQETRSCWANAFLSEAGRGT